MAGSKTETAVRFPESADQKRRLRNVTQDRKAVARMQAEASSGKHKAEDTTTWGPEQLLATTMDDSGNPVPDPASFNDGAKARQKKIKPSSGEEEMNLYEAFNVDFD